MAKPQNPLCHALLFLLQHFSIICTLKCLIIFHTVNADKVLMLYVVHPAIPACTLEPHACRSDKNDILACTHMHSERKDLDHNIVANSNTVLLKAGEASKPWLAPPSLLARC